MKCTTIKMGEGGTAIVCGSQLIQTCACGRAATRLCDWKTGKGRTCDASICDDCTTSQGKNKDLCKGHAKMWADHPINKQRELSL